jgi:hypothetical protein
MVYGCPSSVYGDLCLAVDFVRRCIRDAQRERSKLLIPPGFEVLHAEGQSSDRCRHLVNNLCSPVNTRYLEVGAASRGTLAAAAFANEADLAAVDRWSRRGGFPAAGAAVGGRTGDPSRISFHDSEALQGEACPLPGRYELFVCGSSPSRDAQFEQLTRFSPLWGSVVVVVVDGFNRWEIQTGTLAALKELGCGVRFERFLPSASDGDRLTWWSGLYVAVLDNSRRGNFP